MTEEELILSLHGSAAEQLPLTLNLSDIRSILSSIKVGNSIRAELLNLDSQVTLLKAQGLIKDNQLKQQSEELLMFRGMGAQGNYIIRTEPAIGRWRRFVTKVKSLLRGLL